MEHAAGAASPPDDGGERGEAPASCDDAPKSLAHRAAVQVCDTFLDYYSAFAVFAVYLFTFETFLLCVLSAGSVSFYCVWYSDAGAWTPRRACAAARLRGSVLQPARAAQPVGTRSPARTTSEGCACPRGRRLARADASAPAQASG